MKSLTHASVVTIVFLTYRNKISKGIENMNKNFIQLNTFCIHASAFTNIQNRSKTVYAFLMNPEREMYIREIVRTTQENINSVRRELSNLEEIGLLKSKKGEIQNTML